MRFIIMRKADQNTEAGVMPSNELLLAMGQYNEELVKAGVMLDGMGLHPTSRGYRIQFENGNPIVTDGPFTETKELLAGFTLIQTRTPEEAIEWVKRWPALDGDANVTLELRRVFEMEDFVEGEGIQKHREVEAQLNKPKMKINPYLTFTGNCREAFEYYGQVLGAEPQIMSQGESPIASQIPVEHHHRVMHAHLDLGDSVVMGSDSGEECGASPTSNGAVTLNLDNPELADRIFAALADNGTTIMPLENTFWAKKFGMLVDRFGVKWMINCE